ncbi:MAG: hypothetical protein KBG15_02745, partial [Kofleriaceae bacterium]|nr:hypothetical protein [Kofleriaceae bacterium]
MSLKYPFFSMLAAILGSSACRNTKEVDKVAPITKTSQNDTRDSCANSTEALKATKKPPELDKTVKWPPAEGGACSDNLNSSDRPDFNGDRVSDVTVSCDLDGSDFTVFLYQTQPNGCLLPLGSILGLQWEVLADKSDGYKKISSRSRPSHDEEETLVPETIYAFSPKTKQYEPQDSKVEGYVLDDSSS